MVASTPKGICTVSFVENEMEGVAELKSKWFNARLVNRTSAMHKTILSFFAGDWDHPEKIRLHLKGTPFQIKVWEALLKVPLGSLATYQQIARAVENPGSVRAVGTAVGSNPIAYIIPCHRVIRSTGIIGNYHWGETRKTAMIGWEGGRVFGDENQQVETAGARRKRQL